MRTSLFVLLTVISMALSLQAIRGAPAPALSSEFEVRLTGTEGLEFSGNIMLVQSGSSESQSVEGKVPESYKVSGQMVSVFFQKQGEKGKLILTILKDGEAVKTVETEAKYGAVTAAT